MINGALTVNFRCAMIEPAEIGELTNSTIEAADKSELKCAKEFGLTQRRKDAKSFFIVLIIILCDLASLREQ